MKTKLKDDARGKLFIGIAVLILVVFLLIALFGRQPAPDSVTGCVGKPNGSTAIIIDLSQKTTLQTTETISNRIESILQDVVKPNELVSIYYVNSQSQTDLKDELNKCRPKSMDDKSWNDANKKIRKQFAEFKNAIDSSGVNKRVTAESEKSPIIQTIMDVKKKHQYVGTKRMLIFSDLWEYTDYINMYSCTDYKSVEAKYLERWSVQSPLSDYEVFVGRIPREDYSKDARNCRNRFWVWFLNNSKPLKGYQNILDELPG
jgi:hypothetical protein